MKGKKIAVAISLSFLLIVALVYSFGFFGTANLRLFSSNNPLSAPSAASVFVDPTTFIQDYAAQPIGSKFTLYVNISSVSDLFTWQINLTWNNIVLNVSQLGMGEFLLRTASANKTSSYQLGFVINQTNNVKGYIGMSDSILGSVPGITGSGRLVSVTFLVVGYGTSNISISLLGNLKTSMLNSTSGVVPFTVVDGYFKNKLNGDANGDRAVNSLDLGAVNGHWSPTGGPFPGSLGYSKDIDCNNDGVINSLDLGVINANWGRSA